jgi:intein-encoded DNA endonuclease-like protein
MELVSINTISKIKERQKYLPLEIRIKMHDDVIELRKQGLTYKEIQKIIYEKYRKRLFQPTISYWINGKHNPLGRANKFNGKPSPKLGYVIGAMFSDGYKYFNDEKYRLGLAVKDKEYAEEFGRCLAKVVGRKKPYEPYSNENLKQWIVAGCSIQLFEFLNRPLEELKPYVEHCKDCVASFLRAIFDGDGSIYVKIRRGGKKRKLVLYNTNKELLSYIQYLLKRLFNIDATGPHLARKSGKIFIFPNGKITKTTEDYYYIYIRANSLVNFYKYIGFTIKRKQQNLIEAIKK